MASILLDQDMPHGLRHLLVGHEVRTAYHMGWSDLENGESIAAAEKAGFDVRIAADEGLRHQQNFVGRRLALVEIAGNAWPLVRRNIDAIARGTSLVQPDAFREILFDGPG